MQQVDERHAVVDLCDCREIQGAVAVDLDSGHVTVREVTFAGETQRTIHCPAGLRVVRRH